METTEEENLRNAYEKGRQKVLREIIKIIDDWTFYTMKNFNGIDKDFFKSDVQKLRDKFEEIK